jgi:hypothetical protein
MIEEFWAQNQLTLATILQSILIGAGVFVWRNKSWDHPERVLSACYIIGIIPVLIGIIFTKPGFMVDLVTVQYGVIVLYAVLYGCALVSVSLLGFLGWSLK